MILKENCKLFQKEVWYRRHTVSSERIMTDPMKLKAIQEWPTTRDKHELRSFLLLHTYYRQFIASFADITKLLTELTEEKQTFK
jgi:hypothetical protein